MKNITFFVGVVSVVSIIIGALIFGYSINYLIKYYINYSENEISKIKFSIFDPDCSECNCLVHYSNDIWSIQNCECKKCSGTPEPTIDVPYPFPLTVIP